MSRTVASIAFLVAATQVCATTTLKCDADKRCDAYLKNCVQDSYAFTATVDPERQIVIMGSTSIKADFSNPVEVSFAFTKYTIRLNRFEYSATLTSEDEVRYGWCKKLAPAW